MNFYRCMSFDKKEEILLLKNPRFVNLINNIKKDKYRTNISVDQSLISIESKEIQVNVSNKYDKKNKSHLKLENINDNKKNKTKFKKKVRNKIGVDTDDLLITNNASQLNDDSLEKTFIRHSKSTRSKKKSKAKNNMNSRLTHLTDVDNVNMQNRQIVLDGPISIQDLAFQLKIPEAEIITWLFMKGIPVTVNQFVDTSIAIEVANNYSINVISYSNVDQLSQTSVSEKKLVEISNNSIVRPPVITIFGHIDHGKTTLIDAIRDSNMVSNEIGGITQSINTYEVMWLYKSRQEKLVFLDTPGHEAFTSMRSRGARVTDIAILVVAADDGLKPQTIEAIKYIKNHNLKSVVAINKIDKLNTNIVKIKEELLDYGLISQEWGGETPCIQLSALKKQNIDVLLNTVCNIANSMSIKASINYPAKGIILESYLDKTKGPIANVLVQNGTLEISNIIVAERVYGKVKALINFKLDKVQWAQPSSVVQVWGFSSVPQAGSQFIIVKNEKEAKTTINEYVSSDNQKGLFKSLNTRITSDANNIKNISIKQINLIIKTDTQGSIEAIIHALSQIPQHKIQLNILSASSGIISDTDVDLAATSKSILLAFNTSASLNILNSIKKLSIIFHSSTVIYDLLDFIVNYMLSLVEPEYDKNLIGKATVQSVFEINRGVVAGCVVDDGKIKKQSFINAYRSHELIYEGQLDSLKHMKDDVEEVLMGNECGVMCYGYNLWQKGDIIQVYHMNEKQKSL